MSLISVPVRKTVNDEEIKKMIDYSQWYFCKHAGFITVPVIGIGKVALGFFILTLSFLDSHMMHHSSKQKAVPSSKIPTPGRHKP